MRVRIRHDRLVDVLSRSRLSQNHWALKLGLSSGHISDLVNGRHPYPSPATREKLLRGLGLSFEELFEIETPGAPQSLPGADLRTRFGAEIGDGYIIDGLVGQGGMGTVYLGRDVKHGRQVAIKAVLPDVIAAMGIERFLMEIRRTAQLQHPNILPLLDSGVAADCPYLITPFVKAGSLARLLAEQGRLAPRNALPLLHGICAALEYAHRERIVHCDIKPDNVLISEGVAVVTDFGISRVIHLDGHPRSLRIDTSTGTPAYVSPEQVSGEVVDGRSDQYSVACVAFEMMTGVPPFEGSNDLAVVSRRFIADPPDPREYQPRIPRAVSRVLRRGMAFAPGHRYPGTAAFFQSLEEATAGVGVGPLRRGGTLARATGMRARRVAPSLLAHPPARATHRPPSRLSLATGERSLMALLQDLRFALRSFARQPVFVLIAILTLALGVGANTAVVSVINGTLLRPLPYSNADRLVLIWERRADGGDMAVTGPNFMDWKEQNRTFTAMSTVPLAQFGGPSTVLGGSEPARANVSAVSHDFFRVMGSQPFLGRTLQAADYAGDAAPAVVVSHRFWTRYLGSDSALARHPLRGGRVTFEVVGVMPPAFAYPEGADLWIPDDPSGETSRTSHNWGVVGRLRPGVGLADAQADMSRITTTLRAQVGEAMDAVDARVVGLQDAIVGDVRGPLRLLLGAATLVLLIACANVASTLLAQGTARRRELAVRAAMGASRARVVGQLLGESFLLALAGTAAGLGFGLLLVRGLLALAPPDLSVVGVGLDGSVALFAVLVCGVCTFAFGLYPALVSTRTESGVTLGTGGRSVAGGSRRSWHRLVAVEVALSLVLLIGSALLIRSFQRVMSTDIGFDPAGIVTVDLALPGSAFPGDQSVITYYDEVLASLEAVPGIRAAGLVNHLPLMGMSINGGFEGEGFTADLEGYADYRVVSGEYFEAMGIPLIRGRTFEPRDAMGAPHVAVINTRLAERYWPNEDPVGRRIRSLANDEHWYGNEWITIVGVMGDVRHQALTGEPQAEVYVFYRQRPARARSAILTLQTSGVTPALLTSIRERVRRVHPEVPVQLGTVEDVVRASVAGRRFTMLMISAFSLVALLLAGFGIYGVVTFTVAQRTREMGIRLALGARPAAVRTVVQADVLRITGLGLVAGILGSLLLKGIIGRFLYDVAPTDAVSIGGAALLLGVVAWVASLVPAVRATRVDPLVTMRGAE